MNEDKYKAVDNPQHYCKGRKYECWDVLDDWFSNDPLLWNACKYINRAGRKGNIVDDLQKAVAYLNRRIEKETNI